MTNKFTSSNAEKTKWIHLTTDVKFSQQCYFECLGRFGICDSNTDDQGQKITPGVEMLQADVRDDLPISEFDPTAPARSSAEQIRLPRLAYLSQTSFFFVRARCLSAGLRS